MPSLSPKKRLPNISLKSDITAFFKADSLSCHMNKSTDINCSIIVSSDSGTVGQCAFSLLNIINACDMSNVSKAC